MSLSQPSAAELINAIQTFLTEKVTPQVDKHTAFHLKVTCHMLGILEREVNQQQTAEAVISDCLSLLTGQPCDGATNIDSLNNLLCESIRTGNMAHDDPILLQTLKRMTEARLAIDNPAYSGLNQPE